MNTTLDSHSPGCLNEIRKFLIISSLPVSLAGGIMQYVTYLMAGLDPVIAVCAMGFMVTFAVYSLNKLSDLKEDAVNIPERLVLADHKEMVLALAGVAYAICLIQGWRLFGLLSLMYLAPILMGFIYSFHIPGLPRLKEIPGVKGGVVALAWAVTMGIPLIYAKVGLYTGLVVGAWVFIQVFIDCVVYDVRDIEGDRDNGVKTLPVIWGVRKTTILLLGCNGLLVVLTPLVQARILALIMVVWTFWYILYFGQRRDLLVMDVLIEGNWLIVLAMVYFIAWR